MQSVALEVMRVYEFATSWFPWGNQYKLVHDSSMHSLFHSQILIGKADVYTLPTPYPTKHMEREFILSYSDGYFHARCNADNLTFGEVLTFKIDPQLELKKVYFTFNLVISGRTDEYSFPDKISSESYVSFSDKKKEKVFKSSFEQNSTTFRAVLQFRHYFEETDPIIVQDQFIIVTYVSFPSNNHHFSPDGIWTWNYSLTWSDNAGPLPTENSVSESLLSDDSFEHISVDIDDD